MTKLHIYKLHIYKLNVLEYKIFTSKHSVDFILLDEKSANELFIDISKVNHNYC